MRNGRSNEKGLNWPQHGGLQLSITIKPRRGHASALPSLAAFTQAVPSHLLQAGSHLLEGVLEPPQGRDLPPRGPQRPQHPAGHQGVGGGQEGHPQELRPARAPPRCRSVWQDPPAGGPVSLSPSAPPGGMPHLGLRALTHLAPVSQPNLWIMRTWACSQKPPAKQLPGSPEARGTLQGGSGLSWAQARPEGAQRPHDPLP